MWWWGLNQEDEREKKKKHHGDRCVLGLRRDRVKAVVVFRVSGRTGFLQIPGLVV